MKEEEPFVLFVANFHYLVVEATCVKKHIVDRVIKVIQNRVLKYSTNIFHLLIMNATLPPVFLFSTL